MKDWAVWWGDVISRLLTGWYKKSAPRQSSITFRSDGIVVSNRSRSRHFQSVDALIELIGQAKFQRDLLDRPISIGFENESAIVRKLTGAAIPESRHTAATHFDLQASTPFKPSDFYALNVRPLEGYPGSYYAVVRRSMLRPLLQAIEASNLQLGGMIFDDRGKKFILTQACLKGLSVPKNNWSRRAKAGLFALCAILVPLTFANYVYHQERAISQLNQMIEPLLVDAKALRMELDSRAALVLEMQTLRKSIEDSKLSVVIWEELARVLPDSTFLTDLTITQNKVSIAGYTQSASAIIVALEGSSQFDEVTFTSPVVKVPGRTDDRFSIDFKIGMK